MEKSIMTKPALRTVEKDQDRLAVKNLKSAYQRKLHFMIYIYLAGPARKIVCNLYLLSWTHEKIVYNVSKSYKIF